MRALCLSLLMLTIAAGTAMSESPAEPFFPFAYENYTLDNGLKSVLIPIKGSGLVAYYTVVRTGSRDEWEAGKSGFAHFFEHMMFRGTKNYSAEEYSRLVSEMGANSNAYTSDDITCYYMVIPSSQIATAMDIESDRFQNLAYEEGPFKTEAGAVFGEYNKNATNPVRVAYRQLMDTAFDEHTYKHTTMGLVEDIKAMPDQFDYSKTFYDRYYRPENCVLMIVGDFDAEAVKPMIAERYGSWKKGYVEPKITPEPEQKGERRVDVPYEGKTRARIWIGYKGSAYDPKDKAIVSAHLLGFLAFGGNSELHKKLVIREQKLSRIDGTFSINRDPKLYDIYAIVKNDEDVPYVIEEIDRTIQEFQTNLVSNEELDNIRKRRRYEYLMGLETPHAVASGLARTIAVTGGVEAVNDFYATMDTLTPEDIREAARKFLQKERRTVLTLKAEEGEES